MKWCKIKTRNGLQMKKRYNNKDKVIQQDMNVKIASIQSSNSIIVCFQYVAVYMVLLLISYCMHSQMCIKWDVRYLKKLKWTWGEPEQIHKSCSYFLKCYRYKISVFELRPELLLATRVKKIFKWKVIQGKFNFY